MERTIVHTEVQKLIASTHVEVGDFCEDLELWHSVLDDKDEKYIVIERSGDDTEGSKEEDSKEFHDKYEAEECYKHVLNCMFRTERCIGWLVNFHVD